MIPVHAKGESNNQDNTLDSYTTSVAQLSSMSDGERKVCVTLPGMLSDLALIAAKLIHTNAGRPPT